MKKSPTVKKMWMNYISSLGNVDKEADGYETWHFCNNQSDADELAELVKAGTKRATASLLEAYLAEGEPLPKGGEYSVIINWAGEAQCIIRTTQVDLVPYGDVSEAFAATEGEGDKSLAYWRCAHWPIFEREMEAVGKKPNDQMIIVCERFEVVYQ